jgi:Fur family ferric uptake transcriptional regulator
MERNTRQRSAIRRAFHRAEGPLGPGELLAAAREEVDGIALATIYRTVRTLADEGFITPVLLPGEPPRYELAGRPHHHHFRCTRCGRVVDLPCTARGLDAGVPRGFTVEEHAVVLTGACDRHG